MKTVEHVVLRESTSFEELETIKGWLTPDKEGKRWLVSYLDVATVYRLLSDKRRFLFLEYHGAKIGFVDIETSEDNEVAYFSLYISPEWRKRGLGQASLLAIENYCRKLNVSRIEGGIERENQRSIACALGAGLLLEYPNAPDDDIIVASKDL